MAALLRLSSAIDRVNTFLGRVAAFLVLAAAMISAGNAFIRYAFDRSSNAWLEIQWYLFAAIVLFGAAETLRRNEHVRVDLLYQSWSDRTRLKLDIGGIVLFLLPFCLLLIWLSWRFALRSLSKDMADLLSWPIPLNPPLPDSQVVAEGSSSAGGLVRWPFKMLLPVGFTLLALQGVSELIKRLAALQGSLSLDTTYHKPDQ